MIQDLLTLWDDSIEDVSVGDILEITNGYIRLFQGSMRLNVGRFGSFESSNEIIEDINTENNLSDQRFEQRRNYQRGYGYRRPYQRGYGRSNY